MRQDSWAVQPAAKRADGPGDVRASRGLAETPLGGPDMRKPTIQRRRVPARSAAALRSPAASSDHVARWIEQYVPRGVSRAQWDFALRPFIASALLDLEPPGIATAG